MTPKRRVASRNCCCFSRYFCFCFYFHRCCCCCWWCTYYVSQCSVGARYLELADKRAGPRHNSRSTKGVTCVWTGYGIARRIGHCERDGVMEGGEEDVVGGTDG